MPNAASLLEALKGADPGARRMACEDIGGLREVGEFIPCLVEALGDTDPGVSEAAMNALMDIGGEEVVLKVVPLLRSADAGLRNRAIEILIRAGSAATGPVSAVLTDPDDDVAKFAVDILAGVQDPEAADDVAPLLKHPNPNVRGAAALYMGRAHPEGAAEHIMEALNDPEPWVRFSAIEALGFLSDIRYLEPLLEILRKDDGVLREAALDALSRMATPANAYEILMTMESTIKDPSEIPAASMVEILEKAEGAPWEVGSFINLRDMLYSVFDKAAGNQDLETRKIAFRGFSLLKDERGIGPILGFLDTAGELDEETGEFIIETLSHLVEDGPMQDEVLSRIAEAGPGAHILIQVAGRLRAVEALPALEKALETATKEDARAILRAVDEIGSPDSERMLRKALYSPDGHVRKMAATTLAGLCGAVVADDLFSMLVREKYRDVIEGISDALAGLGTAKVREGFERLLESTRPDMREVACRGLGMMGSEESTEPLVGATKDEDPGVRKAAYLALATLGLPSAEEALARGLGLGESGISTAILEALAEVSTDELRDAIRERLSDEDIWVRHHAATLLGEMEDYEAEERLLHVLAEDVTPVKAAAAGALARLASERAVPLLKDLYEGSDPSLRSAIERAIEEIGC